MMVVVNPFFLEFGEQIIYYYTYKYIYIYIYISNSYFYFRNRPSQLLQKLIINLNSKVMSRNSFIIKGQVSRFEDPDLTHLELRFPNLSSDKRKNLRKDY